MFKVKRGERVMSLGKTCANYLNKQEADYAASLSVTTGHVCETSAVCYLVSPQLCNEGIISIL